MVISGSHTVFKTTLQPYVHSHRYESSLEYQQSIVEPVPESSSCATKCIPPPPGQSYVSMDVHSVSQHESVPSRTSLLNFVPAQICSQHLLTVRRWSGRVVTFKIQRM